MSNSKHKMMPIEQYISSVRDNLKKTSRTEEEIDNIINSLKEKLNKKPAFEFLNNNPVGKLIKGLKEKNNITREDFRSYDFFNHLVTAIVIRKKDTVAVSFSFCKTPCEKQEINRKYGIFFALYNYDSPEKKYTIEYPRCDMMESIFYAIRAFKDLRKTFPSNYKNLDRWTIDVDFDFSHYNNVCKPMIYGEL